MTVTVPEAAALTTTQPTQRDAAVAIVELIDLGLTGHLSASRRGVVHVYLNAFIEEIAPAFDAWQAAVTAGNVTESADDGFTEMTAAGRWGDVEVNIRAIVYKSVADAKDAA